MRLGPWLLVIAFAAVPAAAIRASGIPDAEQRMMGFALIGLGIAVTVISVIRRLAARVMLHKSLLKEPRVGRGLITIRSRPSSETFAVPCTDATKGEDMAGRAKALP
jgi:hypothetical protein